MTMVWTTWIILGGMAAAIGVALSLAGLLLRPEEDALTIRIESLLPQTQCAQCGYPGCRPYAQAIAQGDAPINRCPPGGQALIEQLAGMLGLEDQTLDPRYGEEPSAPQRAQINESRCIGCALCLKACPVDAIIGAPRFMHTVIADQCTGCALCIAPCPVDCISLHADETPRWQWPLPQLAKLRSVP